MPAQPFSNRQLYQSVMDERDAANMCARHSTLQDQAGPVTRRLATLYADQASVPNEVHPFKILSLNRVHEVSGHFLASVLDKNDSEY